MTTNGLAEPPQGAIVGESMPRENERVEMEDSRIDKLVGVLKARPAYHGRSDDELREIIKTEYL